MSSALLEYAEALRTGRNLARARKVRPRLLQKHPGSVAAIDEVMPYAYTDREQHAPSGKRKEQRREAFEQRQRNPAPRRISTPTDAQVAEITRLSTALGRKPWVPEKRWQASAEIDRLRQVRANTRT